MLRGRKQVQTCSPDLRSGVSVIRYKADRKGSYQISNSPAKMGRVWSTMSSSALVADDGHERSVTVLYATETGTAQEVADRIAAQCRRIHVHARVYNLDAYPPVSPCVCSRNTTS